MRMEVRHFMSCSERARTAPNVCNCPVIGIVDAQPQKEAPMIETRRTCVLSMERLTMVTVDMLAARPLIDWPFMGGPVGPDMIIAYCHTENSGADPIPADVWACMTWARTGLGADFEYIIFDRDLGHEEDGCDLPLPLPPAAPAFVPRDVQKGAFVILLDPAMGTDDDEVERIIPAGALWEVIEVRDLSGPQERSVTLGHNSGVVTVLDDSDAAPTFNFVLPKVPVFSVNVRAMRHLTKALNIAAEDEDAARITALDVARRGYEFSWYESDPEDFQVEGFN